MKTARLLAALLLSSIFPSFAFAQSSYPYYTGGLVTRAEFVRMTLDEVGGFTQDGTHCFVDVANQSYAPQVCAAKQRGIVMGRQDGRFMPDQPVAFVEAAAIVVRAKGTSVANDSNWYRPYVQKLSAWDAIPDSVNNILDPLTRDQAMDLINAVWDGDEEDDDEDEEDNEDEDLKLTVTASDATVEEDDTVTFRIKIENKGNDDIDVDVSATLDGAMDFVSADNGGDSDDTGSVDDDEVEWDDVEIDEDDTETLLLTVELNSRADDGDTLKLKVEVEDLSVTKMIKVDDDDEDDDDEDEDLKLTVSDSVDPVPEHGIVTYAIKIENEGNDDIRVDVVAELDDAMDFISATDGGDEDRNDVEWRSIRLDEDETKTVFLAVRLDSGAEDGDTLWLKVEANEEGDTETTNVDDDGDDDDNDDDNDDDENVSISITDSDDPVEVRDVITYRITIENKENEDITIDVRATLDESTSFLSASYNGDDEGDDEVVWEDVTIREDAEKILTLEVRVTNDADDGSSLKLKVEAGDDTDTETTKVED